jgi:hypothetical protein
MSEAISVAASPATVVMSGNEPVANNILSLSFTPRAELPADERLLQI